MCQLYDRRFGTKVVSLIQSEVIQKSDEAGCCDQVGMHVSQHSFGHITRPFDRLSQMNQGEAEPLLLF